MPAVLKNKTLGLRVASVLFAFVAFGHLLRLLIGFDFVIGSLNVPIWASGLAVFVLGALSFWLFRLSQQG